MTPHHFFPLHEGALRSSLDLSGRLDQINRCDDDCKLRDSNATSRRIVEYADVPVARALGSDVANKELGHSVEIRIAHGKPPLCNDTNHLTPGGTVTNIIDAPVAIRFRAAPCVNTTQSTNLAAILNTSVFATFGSGERK